MGNASGVAKYSLLNGNNLKLEKNIDTDFLDNSEIYDAQISPDGKYAVFAGRRPSNKTSSDVLIYNLNSGQFSQDINIASNFLDTNKNLQFSSDGSRLLVTNKNTNTLQLFKMSLNG